MPAREAIVTKTLDLLDRPDITHPADINYLMAVILGYLEAGRNKPCPDASLIWSGPCLICSRIGTSIGNPWSEGSSPSAAWGRG
jgi:hypothetical protein